MNCFNRASRSMRLKRDGKRNLTKQSYEDCRNRGGESQCRINKERNRCFFFVFLVLFRFLQQGGKARRRNDVNAFEPITALSFPIIFIRSDVCGRNQHLACTINL